MMQNIQNLNDNCVQANATCIIKKFRCLQDRLNFCMEKNWHHPCEPGFDATFFLLVLAGKKNICLQILRFRTKCNFFAKMKNWTKITL